MKNEKMIIRRFSLIKQNQISNDFNKFFFPIIVNDYHLIEIEISFFGGKEWR